MYGPQIDTTGFPEEVAASIHRFVAHAAWSNAQHEAAYAQALRDVIEAFGGAFTASNWRTDEVCLDDAIKHFAAERGIDLSE